MPRKLKWSAPQHTQCQICKNCAGSVSLQVYISWKNGKGFKGTSRPNNLRSIAVWLLKQTPAGRCIKSRPGSSKRGGKVQQFRHFCGQRSSPRSIWITALLVRNVMEVNRYRNGINMTLLPCCTACRRLLHSICHLQL